MSEPNKAEHPPVHSSIPSQPSSFPPAPPYSPITPQMTSANLAPATSNPAYSRDHAPPPSSYASFQSNANLQPRPIQQSRPEPPPPSHPAPNQGQIQAQVQARYLQTHAHPARLHTPSQSATNAPLQSRSHITPQVPPYHYSKPPHHQPLTSTASQAPPQHEPHPRPSYSSGSNLQQPAHPPHPPRTTAQLSQSQQAPSQPRHPVQQAPPTPEQHQPPAPQEPPPAPLDLSTNPDAIALRAAMSVLQLQRQQAMRDMQTLQRQKEQALSDPEAFAKAIQRGEIETKDTMRNGIDLDYSDDDEEEGNGNATEQDKMDTADDAGGAKVFGELPGPQNVVRAPPIKWSKYHVVGPALDQQHEKERKDPTEGRPRTDEDVRMEALRRKAREGKVGTVRVDGERLMQGPYDPWRDQLVSTTEHAEGPGREGGIGSKIGGKIGGKEGVKVGEPSEKKRKSSGGAGRKKGKGAKG